MRHLPSLLVVLLMVLGCGQGSGSQANAAPIKRVAPTDMNPDPVYQESELVKRAVAKAKETRSDFVKALTHSKPSYTGFSFKKPYPTKDGGDEHIWVTDVTWDGTHLRGTAGNDGVYVAVKVGDKCSALLDDISDWLYFDNGKMVGGFTERASYWDLSPDDRKKMDKDLPYKMPPIDF